MKFKGARNDWFSNSAFLNSEDDWKHVFVCWQCKPEKISIAKNQVST